MNKRQGFTLIELIISFTLLSLVFCASFSFLGARVRILNKEKKTLKQYQADRRVFNLVAKDLRNCQKFTLSAPFEIKISLKDKDLIYGLKNKKIRRKSGKRNAYLTMPGEIITFECRAINPKLIELTVGQLKQKIYLRNTS